MQQECSIIKAVARKKVRLRQNVHGQILFLRISATRDANTKIESLTSGKTNGYAAINAALNWFRKGTNVVHTLVLFLPPIFRRRCLNSNKTEKND